MKKTVRKMFLVILALMFACAGCGYVEEAKPVVIEPSIEEPVKETEKKPEDIVIKFSDAFKAFDLTTMAGCCSGISKSDLDPKEIFIAKLSQNDREDFAGVINILIDYMKSEAGKVSYEIKNVETGAETATVTVHYSFSDAAPVMRDGTTNWVARGTELAKAGGYTEEDFKSLFEECMTESIKTIEAGSSEVVIKYSCVKKDSEWLISGITGKDDYISLITCKLDNMGAALENSVSKNSKDGNAESSSVKNDTESTKKLTIEKVDSDGTIFKDYFGDVNVSYWMKYKNTSDCDIKLTNTYINYYDNDGKLIGSDQYVQCIPEVLRPGEEGYIYSYHHELGSAYKNNGCKPEVNYVIKKSSSTYTIQCIDGFFKKGGLGIEVTVKAKNNSSNKISFAEPGAVFLGKNGEVLGFCYTLESFEAGETTTFTMSGSLIAYGIDAGKVTDVKVYMQGDASFY